MLDEIGLCLVYDLRFSKGESDAHGILGGWIQDLALCDAEFLGHGRDDGVWIHKERVPGFGIAAVGGLLDTFLLALVLEGEGGRVFLPLVLGLFACGRDAQYPALEDCAIDGRVCFYRVFRNEKQHECISVE